MIAPLPYQLEIAGRLATMYIVGELTAFSTPVLREACDALPPAVQVMSVSLDDSTELDEAGFNVIRDLHQHWRATRNGPSRLAQRVD